MINYCDKTTPLVYNKREQNNFFYWGHKSLIRGVPIYPYIPEYRQTGTTISIRDLGLTGGIMNICDPVY